MRTFVEIVDRGSLTAAAEALDRSQPAVVRTLAALEAHLGVVLLRRTTRRSSLTPEGRDYLDRARRILADVEEAEQAVGDGAGVLRGVLRVSAPVQFGRLHVAPLVAGFVTAHPEVHLDLMLADRVVDLVEEGVDLALRIGALPDSSLVAVPVGEVRRVLVAAPSLLARVGEPEAPEALAGQPCLRVEPLARGTWHFAHGRSVHVDGPLACDDVGAAIAACAAGAGFARVLSYQTRALEASGALVRVLREHEPAPLPVQLVHAGHRRRSRRGRALLAHLRDGLRAGAAFD
jgi:DNA-binding transcriptional LysR family regulator